MPPYYSIFFSLEEYSPQRSIALSSIYEALLINDFKFKDKYPIEKREINSSKDRIFKSIISRNQKKIDNNFKLGWTQHWREDYQQFLLENPFFFHCRVITTSKCIRIIIPEHEITYANFPYCEGIKSLDMELIEQCKKLAINVWKTGLVTSVQTYSEIICYYTPYKDLVRGKLPFIFPFTIINKDCLQKIKQFYPHLELKIQELSRGFLIDSQEAIYGREN